MVQKKSSVPLINLDTISEEELINLRICDLPLTIQGTWIEECIAQLYKELEEKNLIFKPVCYLADEWLTPLNETVVGIPFYLAHPTLMKLEQKMMLEVEGGTKEWCMKLLRHETGHAMTYAFGLHKRKQWKNIFGPASKEYPETYRFRPYSKNYVRHLDDHYAQYHPEEDFVETFAVWLTPNSNWQNKYKGWKALRKLKYVDDLMNDLKGKQPFIKSARKTWRLSTLRMTLNNHYKKRRRSWEEEFPDFHDHNLLKMFSLRMTENKKLPLASKIISEYRKNIIQTVNASTQEKKYIINGLLKNLIKRCRELKLVCNDTDTIAVLKVSTYITTLVMNYAYTGRFKGERKRK